MKIGYDAKRFFQNNSGLGNYSRDLVRILASYYPNNQYLLFNSVATNKAPHITAMPSVAFKSIGKGILARQLKMGEYASECDIFHGLSGELPLKWSNPSIKKIVTIHDLIFEIFPSYYSFFDRKVHFWKFKKATQMADVVVAISEQTKKDIIKYLKTPEDKIKVIYQGCSDKFKIRYSDEQKNLIRYKFNLPQRFILNVGTLEIRKNGLEIIKAIKGTNVNLVFIGKSTSYTDKMMAYIESNHLNDQVIFLNNVNNDDLPIIYQMADVFVYPSEYEGFGIPIIEALFSGTPVITNKEGVFPEAGGPHSKYVNIYSTEELNYAILELWNHKELRLMMAEEGLKYAQKFDDKLIAANWIQLYKCLLAK